MATPQNSGSAPLRANEEATTGSTTDSTHTTDPSLEAAVTEGGEHPERAAELAAELGVDLAGDQPKGVAEDNEHSEPAGEFADQLKTWLGAFDQIAPAVRSLNKWLEQWADGDGHFDDINRYARSLDRSGPISTLMDVLLDGLADYGWNETRIAKRNVKKIRQDFSGVAAQLIRVGVLATLDKLFPAGLPKRSAGEANADGAAPLLLSILRPCSFVPVENSPEFYEEIPAGAFEYGLGRQIAFAETEAMAQQLSANYLPWGLSFGKQVEQSLLYASVVQEIVDAMIGKAPAEDLAGLLREAAVRTFQAGWIAAMDHDRLSAARETQALEADPITVLADQIAKLKRPQSQEHWTLHELEAAMTQLRVDTKLLSDEGVSRARVAELTDLFRRKIGLGAVDPDVLLAEGTGLGKTTRLPPVSSASSKNQRPTFLIMRRGTAD